MVVQKEKDNFLRPLSNINNNVLFHPSDDILMERNVDTSSVIKDNFKVLTSKNNWATKEDPELCDYRGGNYGFNSDDLVYKKLEALSQVGELGRKIYWVEFFMH